MVGFGDFDRSAWDRILSNEFDVSGVSHLGGVALAGTLLQHTARSPGRMAQRDWLLERKPEQRRRIDTDRLRDIVDYAAFKCHPQCSIARDQAVEGSDIDGALVVLNELVDTETEMAFVAELKGQGFSVCHATEAQEAVDLWNRYCSDEGMEVSDAAVAQASLNERQLPLRQVTFVTLAEMEARVQQGPLDPTTAVYLAGHTI